MQELRYARKKVEGKLGCGREVPTNHHGSLCFQLVTPLASNERIRPICLDSGIHLTDGELAVVAGWGWTKSDFGRGKLPSQVHTGQVEFSKISLEISSLCFHLVTPLASVFSVGFFAFLRLLLTEKTN